MKKFLKIAKYYFIGSGVLLGLLIIYLAITAKPKPQQVIQLPKYEVLEKIDRQKFKEGLWGEVLVSSFSRSTPKAELEKYANHIGNKEGFSQLFFYCSKEAMKANSSDSFKRKHPNAIKKCYLGKYKVTQRKSSALYKMIKSN